MGRRSGKSLNFGSNFESAKYLKNNAFPKIYESSRTFVGAPSEARLCQLGAEPSLGSPGEAPSTECCVGEGNDVDEAYTGR